MQSGPITYTLGRQHWPLRGAPLGARAGETHAPSIEPEVQHIRWLNGMSEGMKRWYLSAPRSQRHGYLQACLQIELCRQNQTQALFLGNLGLMDLPDDLWQMSWIRQLHLGGNQLSSIPPQIVALSSLTHLLAGNNRIARLDPSLCQLQWLRVVDLSHNQITELPSHLPDLISLRQCYLQGNPLESLPKEGALLPRECTIMLSPLTPSMLRNMESLTPDTLRFAGRSDSPVVIIDWHTPRLWRAPDYNGARFEPARGG